MKGRALSPRSINALLPGSIFRKVVDDVLCNSAMNRRRLFFNIAREHSQLKLNYFAQFPTANARVLQVRTCGRWGGERGRVADIIMSGFTFLFVILSIKRYDRLCTVLNCYTYKYISSPQSSNTQSQKMLALQGIHSNEYFCQNRLNIYLCHFDNVV